MYTQPGYNEQPLDIYDQELSAMEDQALGYGGQSYLTRDSQVNDKILSSASKFKKIIRVVPKFEETEYAVPLVDENGAIVYKTVFVDGVESKVPVIKKLATFLRVVSFENEEIDFPIPDWFNDSVTSSSLTPQEASYIRRADDIAITLFLRSLTSEKVNYARFLNRIYFQKSTLADTGKGIGGRAMEMAKTTITKGESLVQAIRKEQQMQAFEEKKNSGLLGGKIIPGMI